MSSGGLAIWTESSIRDFPDVWFSLLTRYSYGKPRGESGWIRFYRSHMRTA